MTPLEITLLILVLTIVAFITGKIPFSVISAGIMLSLIMTGVKAGADTFVRIGTCGGIQWIYQHKCGHVCGNVCHWSRTYENKSDR